MERGYSLADIGALMNSRNDNCFGGDGAWWVILLLFFVWGGNGAYGGGRGSLGAEMQQGFDTNRVLSKLDGINSGLCDGFYAMNTNNLQSTSALQQSLCQGFSGVNSAIAENRFAAQQCCCETQRSIDAVRADNYKNTCEITNAIHAEGEQTRALITQNEMQTLRDKLADQRLEIQSRDSQLSQLSQTSTIINTLRPTPTPAYITCSPYTSANNFCPWGNGGF